MLSTGRCGQGVCTSESNMQDAPRAWRCRCWRLVTRIRRAMGSGSGCTGGDCASGEAYESLRGWLCFIYVWPSGLQAALPHVQGVLSLSIGTVASDSFEQVVTLISSNTRHFQIRSAKLIGDSESNFDEVLFQSLTRISKTVFARASGCFSPLLRTYFQ